jgi:EAL domain-containing protein (putative c-di-GMP-specific phosphodiesterase class I)
MSNEAPAEPADNTLAHALMDCDFVQGFLFAKPQPAVQALALI